MKAKARAWWGLRSESVPSLGKHIVCTGTGPTTMRLGTDKLDEIEELALKLTPDRSAI